MASSEQATTEITQDVGFDKEKATINDPFAAQRDDGANTFENGTSPAVTEDKDAAATEIHSTESQGDEWDASKTPPSRFQQRKGSIYATPGSRDGHVARNTDRDAAYHAKLEERGWGTKDKDRRGSKASN